MKQPFYLIEDFDFLNKQVISYLKRYVFTGTNLNNDLPTHFKVRKNIMFKKTLAICVLIMISFAFAPLAQAAHHGMKKDIVDVAVENGSFTTLVTALKAAELVETLKGKGAFTVFAPTDEAFAKLLKVR